jgi:hypothetical protein
MAISSGDRGGGAGDNDGPVLDGVTSTTEEAGEEIDVDEISGDAVPACGVQAVTVHTVTMTAVADTRPTRWRVPAAAAVCRVYSVPFMVHFRSGGC